MIIISEREKGRQPNESCPDFYYRIVGGNLAKTMSEHNIAAQDALFRSVNAGSAKYRAVENGDGTIHMYSFHADDLPKFAPPTGDVFNQFQFKKF
jgi:hypothetical protein